jgi:hypothetical protein
MLCSVISIVNRSLPLPSHDAPNDAPLCASAVPRPMHDAQYEEAAKSVRKYSQLGFNAEDVSAHLIDAEQESRKSTGTRGIPQTL